MSRRQARAPGALCGPLLMAALLLPSPAHAGNDESILLGGEAAITGGAVTAFVSDGAAAWYNPAGLALSKRNTLDVTASLYGIRLNSATGIVVTPDGTSLDADNIDWVIVPSAVSYVRELSDTWVGSFSIFIPQRSDYVLRSSATTGDGEQWNYTQQLLSSEYNYTLGFAAILSDRLRMGFTVAGVYASTYASNQLGAGVPATSAASLLISEIRSVGNYGLKATYGVQWDPTQSLSLGATLVSPTLTGISDRVSTLLANASMPGPDGDSIYVAEDTSGLVWPWDMTAPAKLRVGVAYRIGPWMVSLDGDVSTPVASEDAELDRKWSGNGRVAGAYQLSSTMTLGGGVFTDLSALKAHRRDFMGLAFGLRFKKNYTFENGSPLTFSTTLGGRYAYGWGSVEGVRIAAADDGTLDALEIEAPFSSHELGLNVTSFVTF